MKHQSPKRAALMRQAGPWRKALIEEVERCERCSAPFSLTCHEIARGSHRESALMERYAILVLCPDCHREVHEGNWPLERQLALLGCSRPGDLDLVKFNYLRGRAPGAITFLDLLPYLEVRG